LPDDEAIAAALGSPRKASTTISTLEPHRDRVGAWVEEGVSGTATHAVLKRQHGWTGSYSAVRRLVADVRSQLSPETTCRLDFEPGDSAQIDFGAGPTLVHPDGQPRRTWAFVMTLANSRHQYVEFVWDQTVATWLGCHRRAFEWFAGVPRRVIIDNAFSTRLRRAQFRTTKTLEQFDFERLPQLNRALVHDLATGRYLHEKAPVLVVGPCGTGKSHLAQAPGHCAVRQGVDVVFTTCTNLTHSLNAARATGSYERKLATLARVPLLIIDDFGLKPLRAPADEDLHTLIAERYEQAATIVTSNLDFTEWDQAFPANRLLASASLDRLRHNAYCLVLDGQSYRAPKQFAGHAKSAAQKPSKSTPA
jgi:DNA replication protein DnaC